MKIEFTDKGSNTIFRELQNVALFQKAANKGITQAFYKMGKDLKKDAVNSIKSGTKTGKVYSVNVNGVTRLHRASAPGETPANLTGALAKSIGYDVSGSSYKMEYFADTPYAAWLEDGTKNMSARPYLIATIDSNEKNTVEHFQTEIERAFKK